MKDSTSVILRSNGVYTIPRPLNWHHTDTHQETSSSSSYPQRLRLTAICQSIYVCLQSRCQLINKLSPCSPKVDFPIQGKGGRTGVVNCLLSISLLGLNVIAYHVYLSCITITSGSSTTVRMNSAARAMVAPSMTR